MKKTTKKTTKRKPQRVVLVRTYSAGVHCGVLKSYKGTEVTLTDATRIWRWRGANTLSELSQTGCDAEYSRISERVPSIILTQSVEIIDCSKQAAENLRQPRWGK